MSEAARATVRQALCDKLFRGDAPYRTWKNHTDKRADHSYPHTGITRDFIARSFASLPQHPRLIVEVGSFKGGSAIRFANHIKAGRLECVLLCIDTFLGGVLMRADHDGWLDWLALEGGHPTVYDQFVANVTDAGHRDVVLPLVATSTVGLMVLESLGERADMVFLDASHQKDETALELRLIRRILRPEGIVIGDDYQWEGVRLDVDEFAKRERISLSVEQGRFWTIKT